MTEKLAAGLGEGVKGLVVPPIWRIERCTKHEDYVPDCCLCNEEILTIKTEKAYRAGAKAALEAAARLPAAKCKFCYGEGSVGQADEGTLAECPYCAHARKLVEVVAKEAVQLAIMRSELTWDADTETTEEEIAEDAAWALFGEGTCSEKPTENTQELLAALATPSPQAGNGMVRRCMARNSETGQCELREGHATKHLAGMLMWGEAIEDATNPVADPEYVRTMEAPAATQEPAGSGAKTDLELARGVRAHVLNDWQGERVEREVIKALEIVRAETVATVLKSGSPRKVGEDGQPEKYERTHSRVWINAWNAAIEECAKHLREGWSVANKDNGDDVMEVLMEELGGLMLSTPSIVGGPSSVPVGEQKQEEGV